MKRLAIISTHPIQYNAPWFELLTKRKNVAVKVFYTRGHLQQQGDYDSGFGKVIKWDIPLLEGYEYKFIDNISKNPGTDRFNGIDNPTLNKEIASWKPDAILVFGWNFKSHLNCIRYFHKKVPIIFRGDSTLLDEQNGFRKTLRRIFLKWLYRHIDIALFTGTNNKAYFVAHGLKEDQLFFAPHAIDNSRFSDQGLMFSERAKLWRKELGFNYDDIVIVFAGKLEHKKDPTLLLEVAKRSTDDRLKFVFVGNGELENQLKVQGSNLSSVQFVDFQNQTVMPVVYRLGDVFVLPSKGPGETWGLALNEAMASGMPVIASDKVGGAIDLISNGLNGFIFQSGDAGDLQQQLRNFITSPDRLTMGTQSEKIIRQWNFDRIIDAVESAVNRGLGN